MAAAVADYRPASPADGKRAKNADAWTVELEPTADVLEAIGAARRPGQVIVGFAADTGAQGLERAREKRRVKNADLFVFNDVGRQDIGFDAPDNEVVVLSDNGDRTIPKAPKSVVAAAVLDEVERLLSSI
jgi:phosphopantothenoylcysteine decarboxylase / phosphopantothenate---cysteine ligase